MSVFENVVWFINSDDDDVHSIHVHVENSATTDTF